MALKKSQLYSSLWQSCDELRGGMDASQYKDYILTLLFVKYVSDRRASDPKSLIEVPPGGGFADMVKLKGDKEIGEKVDKIIANLAEANDLQGVIDVASFNDEDRLGKGKEMVDRLSKLIGIFEGLDFGANHVEGDDLLGDAYEYLMRHFATESGKSKGQFYTPAEVSRIIAKVVGIGPKTRQDQTLYDPTCGSGSLLLKAADEAPHGLTIYGQEIDNATWALARMNMFLHGNDTAELKKGNTLSAPQLKDKSGKLQTFDFAVANPPFSSKAWSNGVNVENDEFERFEHGTPPPKNGDYAFLLHLIKSLKSSGKGAIILPHGVLFRGNKEADIRQNLVRNGLIRAIVGLPPNLFYGTGIAACIVVVDKENASSRTGVFIVDASRSFIKDGNKNRLREQDIHRIVDVFNKQIDVPGYSRMVPLPEIAGPSNDYNLNIPRYIDSSEPEDIQDLDAHLHGGIPNRDLDALDHYWLAFPSLRKALFDAGDRPGYSRAKMNPHQVKAAVLAHPEFQAFADKVSTIFDGWADAHLPALAAVTVGAKPKEIIQKLSEDLLARFSNVSLLDRYDVYQRLMDYWTETMQDDLYLISTEGWLAAARTRRVVEVPDQKLKETPDLVVDHMKYKTDLLPPDLVVARFLAKDRRALEALETANGVAARALEDFVEENSGEDSILEGARDDKGVVKKGLVKELLPQVRGDEESTKVLAECLELIEAVTEAERTFKHALVALDVKVLSEYGELSEAKVKELVIGPKWLNSIRAQIVGEVDHTVNRLVSRLTELEERYATPLPSLQSEVVRFDGLVTNHLRAMGLRIS
ncbi:MAG: N-6 DNA methylase [Thermoplasmata archaeon]